MIVIGAGGFAKELVEILISEKYNYNESNLFFFDNVNHIKDKKVLGRFQILKTFAQISKIFAEVSKEFSLGIGDVKNRLELCKKFEALGGVPKTIISPRASVGSDVGEIKAGVTIMDFVVITNASKIGKGTLINSHCLVGHDASVGKFCSISPGVKITGHCEVQDYISIGTGAIILPNVKLGRNSYIGAGSVVANDVPEDSLIVGVIPSRVVSKVPERDRIND